ncbi:uncharacterized protein METZ01_LOCUS361297, partial [marine metagenome]
MFPLNSQQGVSYRSGYVRLSRTIVQALKKSTVASGTPTADRSEVMIEMSHRVLVFVAVATAVLAVVVLGPASASSQSAVPRTA